MKLHESFSQLQKLSITHVIKGINTVMFHDSKTWWWFMSCFFTFRCLKCSASFFKSIIFFLTIDLRSAWSNLYFSSAALLSNLSCSSSSSTSSSSLELYSNCISGVTLMSSKLYSFLFTKSPVTSSEGGKVWVVYTLHY